MFSMLLQHIRILSFKRLTVVSEDIVSSRDRSPHSDFNVIP